MATSNSTPISTTLTDVTRALRIRDLRGIRDALRPERDCAKAASRSRCLPVRPASELLGGAIPNPPTAGPESSGASTPDWREIRRRAPPVGGRVWWLASRNASQAPPWPRAIPPLVDPDADRPHRAAVAQALEREKAAVAQAADQARMRHTPGPSELGQRRIRRSSSRATRFFDGESASTGKQSWLYRSDERGLESPPRRFEGRRPPAP